jgi:magnesium transporter
MHIPAVILSGAEEYLSSSHHPDQDSGTSGWSSLIGIITAIVGNILISFALNTQRYAHVRLEKEYNEKRGLSLNKQGPDSSVSYGTAQQDGTPKPNGNGHRSPDENDEDFRRMQESFRSEDTIRPDDREEESDDGRKSYLKSPMWWTGIILMTVGETGNFLAYAFAPASIVSPLGVVALISNCLIAPLMLKERFRQRDFWGVIVAIAGAVTVVLSAKQNETKLDPEQLWEMYVKRWEFLVYVLITCIAIVGLMFASPKYGKRTILVDLGLVGLFGGYTALSTKGVASLLSTELWKAFAFPIFYVLVLILVGSAILQIRYLNQALQNYDSTQVIPTQFVMFTLSVIIGSAVLYRDFESTTSDRAIKFVAGCLLTFFGVYLITSKRTSPESEKEGFGEQDETAPLLTRETEDISERTPTRRRSTAQETHPSQRHSLPQTPPDSPPHPPSVPSIAVTPASASSNERNPWASSTSIPRPETPHRSQSDITPTKDTPYYTPSTSQANRRSVTYEPETPTRRSHSPPKPDPSARMAADADLPSNTFRSARNSISRLIPGPLLPPLSSSLSGIVAESLRRGEGSPLSVRQRLKRSRMRSGLAGRRRSLAPGDEESLGRYSGFTSSSNDVGGGESPAAMQLQREASESAPDVTSAESGNASGASGREGKKPNRLRSLSETFGSLLAGARGEQKAGGSGNANGKQRERDDR